MSAALRATTSSTTRCTAPSFWAPKAKGLHDLVRKRCDFLVSIPMLGHVPSLNVSVAGAVVMYEVARQRTGRARQGES